MSLEIKSIEQLIELKELNFNNPYTQRKFKLNDIEQVKFLIENYKINFAFGIFYLGRSYSLYKEVDNIYIRDDNKYEFEFPHCPPPVTTDYCLKSNSVDEIVKFIEKSYEDLVGLNGFLDL